jgi:hypothetical protein
MDDMRLDAKSPQEDEFALATMGAPSFLNCLYFPRNISRVFAEQVLFCGLAQERLACWRNALLYYLAKLAALHPGRRLLLKNPAHSGRIAELHALFPGAKFVHIHRDPASVFRSTRKFYHRMLPLVALQSYRPEAVDSHIVWSYPQLMSRLLESLAQVPASSVSTVCYRELVSDPVSTVRRVYGELDLGSFEPVEPAIRGYFMDQPAGAPPVAEVDPETASRIAFHWGAVAARLGYRLSPEHKVRLV